MLHPLRGHFRLARRLQGIGEEHQARHLAARYRGFIREQEGGHPAAKRAAPDEERTPVLPRCPIQHGGDAGDGAAGTIGTPPPGFRCRQVEPDGADVSFGEGLGQRNETRRVPITASAVGEEQDGRGRRGPSWFMDRDTHRSAPTVGGVVNRGRGTAGAHRRNPAGQDLPILGSVRFPSADATNSTASSAVWLRMSRIGFTSATSSERSPPLSATASISVCASR